MGINEMLMNWALHCITSTPPYTHDCIGLNQS